MYKCKICGKKYTDLISLYNHIENKHNEMIPTDMTVQQYYYFMKTGKSNGNCVMCKQPTAWNKNTNKYNRFCGDPKCKDKYVKIAKSRMIAKYGKVHLLNDPKKQREMLANRKISGRYKWTDSEKETVYTGSYELDFLRTLDSFFEWDPDDISMPSPHTYTYMYEGEEKFYIPDAFIHSLDLEIEIKDGGDNPNNHYKIQNIDKEKERLKDEVLTSQKLFHYIKITNKNYTNFFDFLKEVKSGFEKYGDDKKIPRIFKIEDIKSNNTVVRESSHSLAEYLHSDGDEFDYLNDNIIKEGTIIIDKLLTFFEKPKEYIMNKKVKLYHSSEVDINTNYLSPKAINVGATKFSKPRWSTFFWDDEEYAMKWMIYKSLLNHLPYVTYTGLNNKIVIGTSNTNILNAIDSSNIYGFIYECEVNARDIEIGSSVNIPEYTISTKIPIKNKRKIKITKDLINKYCVIYHTKEDYIKNIKMSKDKTRNSWILNNLILNDLRDFYRPMISDAASRSGMYIGDDISDFGKIINYAVKKNLYNIHESFFDDTLEESSFMNMFINATLKDIEPFVNYVYDVKKDSPKQLKEYLSKIIKKSKSEEDIKVVKTIIGKSHSYYHNLIKKKPSINDEYNDYVKWVNSELPGEIRERMKKINKSKIVYESSLSMSQINNYLQNEYDKELQNYLSDYKKFYHRMIKEKPETIPNLNEDIRRALIFIDGLSNKGVVNDLVYFTKMELGDLVEDNKKHKSVKRIKESSIEESVNLELVDYDNLENSSDTININIIYDQVNRPRVAFTLNDLDSKIEVEGRYTIKKEQFGVNYIITPGSVNHLGKQVIYYQVKFDTPISIDDNIKDKIRENAITQINGVFNLDDLENKFIKEVCLRLFGKYPVECIRK